jgi:hypothetical protein
MATDRADAAIALQWPVAVGWLSPQAPIGADPEADPLNPESAKESVQPLSSSCRISACDKDMENDSFLLIFFSKERIPGVLSFTFILPI